MIRNILQQQHEERDILLQKAYIGRIEDTVITGYLLFKNIEIVPKHDFMGAIAEIADALHG
jgi:hypothetical protein